MLQTVQLGLGTQAAGLASEFDRSMPHHLRNDLFNDGVYDPREMVEAFAHPENRHRETTSLAA